MSRVFWRGVPLRRVLCVLSAAVLGACSRPPAAPNVLLISIDSLRADRVGIYGNPRPTTPTLDRLARAGVTFDRALSPTSWTLPAHATILTGLAQHHHHVVSVRDRLDDSIERLPDVFARQGYETVGFYSGPFLHPEFGFAKGFGAYVSCQDERTARLQGEGERVTGHGDRTNPLIEKAFVAWLKRRTAERQAAPFFAFVHMWDVHYDYIPPEPYASMFDPDYHGPLDGHDIVGKGFPLDASPRDVDHLRALYDGELRYTDDTIAHLLNELDARGLLESTLIVVTADHGDEFLEHRGKGHQATVFEEVIHVPLIVSAAPALATERGIEGGLRVGEPVSLVDLAPTVLELAGLPPLARADGRSLAPLVAGRGLPEAPVYSVLYSDYIAFRLVAMRQGTTKLIFASYGGRLDLYDLERDPGEHQPVALRRKAMPDKQLKVELARYDREAQRELLPYVRARDAAPVRRELPSGLVERLRELGYVK